MANQVDVRGNGIDWGKALVAGMVSMAVFAAILMAFGWTVRGASPWRPLDIVGAIVLGQPTSDSILAHTAATSAAGGLLLLVLGALSGVVVAFLVHRMHAVLALVTGVAFGLAMYTVDMHGLARIFPALEMLRGWSTLIAYAIQGGLAAGLYKAMVRALVETMPEYAGNDMRRLREVSLT